MGNDTIHRMRVGDWAALLTLSFIWGGSFFFNGVALRELPPFLVVFGRVSIGSLGLLCVLLATRHEIRPHLHRWKELIGLGMLTTAMPFSLIVWGQQHIPSGLASVINATTPSFTILVTHFFLMDERASVRKFTGAALGLGGVAVLIGTDALTGFGDHVLGQLAVLGASFCYACSVTAARRIADVPPLVMAWGQLTGGSIVMLPMAAYFCRPWELPMPSLNVLGAVIGLGLVCSTLAYTIFFPMLKRVGGTNVSLVTLLIPFSATGLGVTFLGEPFTLRLIIGMGIVSSAILIIDGRIRLFRFDRKRPQSQSPR